jgi:hypothetical protein
LPPTSCHHLNPETPPPSPSLTQSGCQCCSALAAPCSVSASPGGTTADPARALATRAAQPELLPPKSPPTPSPPPAKCMRKVAKRRCEVELLRGLGVEDDLCLSPPLHTPPLPARSQLPPSPVPASSPTLKHVFSLHYYPQQPPTPTCGTQHHSSPAQAPSSISLLPTSSKRPSPLPIAVQATGQLDIPALSSASSPPSSPDRRTLMPTAAQVTGATSTPSPALPKPPAPPPWPKAYVFSMDPDRIICRKCCKRNFNYRWCSHYFMCHMNEKKT